MCEPASIIAGGGAILGAVGSNQAGQAGAAQAAFASTIARSNVVIARQKAKDAIARGDVASARHGVEVKQAIATQRAAAAASGVAVDEGSALDITLDTAAFGRLDQLTIQNNAIREQIAFLQQRDQFLLEEQAGVSSGAAATAAGQLGAASSLLGGASNVIGVSSSAAGVSQKTNIPASGSGRV